MGYECFMSYLGNITQCVHYSNCYSVHKLNSYGVLQGSIIGPFLFMLYLNGIVNVSDVLFLMTFAYATHVFINGKDPDEVVSLVNKEYISKASDVANKCK